MQDGQATNALQGVCLIARGWSFGRSFLFFQERHHDARLKRVTAPAELEPPRGLGFGYWDYDSIGLNCADVLRRFDHWPQDICRKVFV